MMEAQEKTTPKEDHEFYAYCENPFRTIIETYKQIQSIPLQGWYERKQQTTA